MPQTLTCRTCDYGITLGWFHYHDMSSGYGSQTGFACGNCGVTHYVEHAIGEDKPDRYLYHRERSDMATGDMAEEMPEPRISNDEFASFDDFVCPVCKAKGNVLTEESLEDGLPDCPLCGEPFEHAGFWIT